MTHVLRDYAVLADGERGALVGPTGNIDWMCFPAWHDDAICSALLGGLGGISITPVDDFVWGGYYEPRSLIWHSRWVTRQAIVESRDALAFPGNKNRAIILRRLSALDVTARVKVQIDLHPHFGAAHLDQWHSHRNMWSANSNDVFVRCIGLTNAHLHHGVLTCETTLQPGEHHDIAFEISAEAPNDAIISPEIAWKGTEAAWEREVPEFPAVVGQNDVCHSFAVLRGLTSASGAMVAAATTSLPERAETDRSYDYRFAWIRDQAMTGQALASANAVELAHCAVRFITERLLDDGDNIQPAYTVDGHSIPDQQNIDLPGYPGGTDVVGNHVYAQFQLDTFGESLLLFAAAAKLDLLDADAWKAIDIAAKAIHDKHNEKDNGIWELERRQWTHSKLICAAGLKAMTTVHPNGKKSGLWLTLADALIATADEHCLHASGRWKRAADDDRIDAALLVPAIRGLLSANDPRTIATVSAVEHDLSVDGYVYRYRPDARPLGEAEGAFALCGFWLSQAKWQANDHIGAARLFERNRSASGPPALLAEEFDVRERQLRGNLPQAFVHAALIETAIMQSQ